MTHSLPENYRLDNRYLITKVIGQGGFGITYEAKDEKLDMKVCLKELYISGNSTRGINYTVVSQSLNSFSFTDFEDRFIQEARQLAKFKQPNIVRVLDIFQENQTAYMVMEFVEGETLKDWVSEKGPIALEDAFPIMQQLLNAVEAVHQAGMLHRDIKPDNILITKKMQVVLIDFGSAREFTDGKTTTQTAILTPGYAPPEQYSDRAQRGPFTDIYALGATMYYMLTGVKPLAVTDRFSEEIEAVHEINPEISSQVSSAIMLALELKPENRFQNAADFRAALKQLNQKSAKEKAIPKKKEPKEKTDTLEEDSFKRTVIVEAQKEEEINPIVGCVASTILIAFIAGIIWGLIYFRAFNPIIRFFSLYKSTSSSSTPASSKPRLDCFSIPRDYLTMYSGFIEEGRLEDEKAHSVYLSAFTFYR